MSLFLSFLERLFHTFDSICKDIPIGALVENDGVMSMVLSLDPVVTADKA